MKIKKTYKLLTLIGLIATTLITTTITSSAVFTNSTSTNSNYDRAAAYNYMTQYTTNKNTAYAYFSGVGGDCTNWASQVLKAGNMAMRGVKGSNRDSLSNWFYYGTYPNYSTTWTGAHFFRQHWGDVNGSGVKRAYRMTNYTVSSALTNLSTIRNDVWNGDIIQHTKAADATTYHSQVVYSYPSGDITISNHSGLKGDAFESFKSFLQNRINGGRGGDYVSVIQIKYY